MDEVPIILAATMPDSFLDFIVMILPIGVLRKLQMSLRHKINLAIVFVLGGLKVENEMQRIFSE